MEVQKALAQHRPEASGFYLLQDGLSAFAARAALIEAASVSLDLQYYIFEDDTVGRILLSLLLNAADRGVRIRLLVDDLGTRVVNPVVLTLDEHPLIDIRVFNPVLGRSGIRRTLEQALNFGRINHRMHNKLFVTDGLLLITGGRNIADGYFSRADVEFLDVDVMALGQVLPQAAQIFDDYWNNPVSVPVTELSLESADDRNLDELRGEIKRFLEQEAKTEFTEALRESRLAGEIIAGAIPFQWGWGTLFADPPEKALHRERIPVEAFPGYKLEKIIRNSRANLRISAAYFIPGKVGTKLFSNLQGAGVNVDILTNSLSSNDVAIVHGAYARYRKQLLKLGVDIWELRKAPGEKRHKHWFQGKSSATLHAKTFVIDDGLGFVGSINLDSRSILQNTEIGLLMESEAINRELSALFDDWVAGDSAWYLSLTEHGQIRWRARDDEGRVLLETRDPETTIWQRWLCWLLSWLPVESQI
ncbi:phospholipase D family protein [Microbulbifer bruguierae]|uniref:Phospholipase D family protein n=1 Tax=Microbulbifer bruguierae TaxID=3029061 RepID=A0ABY8NHR3_9GAMM|nr:phospholipase D family protein [Microbulbifer bruguierae]WGL18480.1 phospholipase D family protein [Microbulbifer bruguierae]